MPTFRILAGRGPAPRTRAALLAAALLLPLAAPAARAQQMASAGSFAPAGPSRGIPGAVAMPTASPATREAEKAPAVPAQPAPAAASPAPAPSKAASSKPAPAKPKAASAAAAKKTTTAKASAPRTTRAAKPASPSRPVELASKEAPRRAEAAYTVPHVHPDFDEGRLPFSLRFNGIESSWNRMAAFVMPGGHLDFDVHGGSGSFTGEAGGGKLQAKGPTSWTWTAPQQHGDHMISVRDERSGEVALLRVFVLHPYDGGDRVGSYPVGRYQPTPKDGDPAYNRPQGFVEVTERNVDVMLTPHFRLSQFLCREESDWPKYVALRTELLVKLETLLDALARRGLPAESLHVMSAFRTPAHNAEAGLETTYSRHTYGDAADVFLDRDGDGLQDDLNHDGKVTREDARVLYDLVEGTLDKALPAQMVGGLSVYGRTGAHGPYIHLDTRGKRIRW